VIDGQGINGLTKKDIHIKLNKSRKKGKTIFINSFTGKGGEDIT